MDKIDLIYDIVKKTSDDVDEIKKDITGIKVENTKQTGMIEVNKITLEEHSRRSTASENRLNEVEKQLKPISAKKLIGIISGAIIGLGGIAAAIIKIFNLSSLV